MQALFGGIFAIAGLVTLRSDGPSDLAGWTQHGLGFLLVTAMVVGSLRIALGEELGVWRSLALLAGSLLAGAVGALMMAAAAGN